MKRQPCKSGAAVADLTPARIPGAAGLGPGADPLYPTPCVAAQAFL